MKKHYIKTDCEIYDLDDLYVCDDLVDKPYATKSDHWCIYRNSIIAEADNIVDLCDRFIGVDKEDNHCIISKIQYKTIGFGGRKNEWKEIYGAIWTPKGLEYAAKLVDGNWITI